MKLFEITSHYDFVLVCADSWVQAIDIFKKHYYPESLLNDPKYGPIYQERLSSMDISFDENSEWTIKELNIARPRYLCHYSF